MKKWHNIPISFLFLLIILFSCEKRDKVVETDKEEFEIEDHIIIGRSMKIQISNMPEIFKILDSARYKDAYGYMSQLLQTLKLTSVVKHRNDFNWDVTILHDDNIKTAFTLPGGHIYVYTGLLHFLSAEHELMAVLGNEIAYADRALVIKTLRAEYGGVLLGNIILGEEVSSLPEIVRNIPSIEFTQNIVEMADEFAIELICPFQYDVTGLEQFIQKAQAGQIKWIQSKKGDINSRLAKILERATPCGEGGVTNQEQYKSKIKNFLP